MTKVLKKIAALAMAAVTAGALGLSAFAGGPMPQEDELAAESKVSAAAAQTALPSGLSVGTTYSLVSEMSADSYLFALNVWGAQDINNANVDMWKWDGSKEQRFRLISSGSYYKLEAVCSSNGRVLNANNLNTSGCNANLWLNQDSKNNAQQLVITKDSKSNGYVIKLASNNNLALTAVSLVNNGAVQFKTYTGASNQKWKFFESNDTLQRAPHPYFKNKSMWCWASAAKMVADHNGGGIDSQIDRAPQMLTNTEGIHKTFYGQGTIDGTTRYFVDGTQYAIVKYIKNNDKNLEANTNEVQKALKFAAANKNIDTAYTNENDLTTTEIINNVNGELTAGRYVIGFVNGNGGGHFIVLEKFDNADTFIVFNPWDEKEMAVKQDILFGENNQYLYLSYSYGRMSGYLSCKQAS